MIVTIATLTVDPEDAGETRDALNTLAVASRDDAGCQSYEFLESTEQPGRFKSVETWDDQASLDAHLQQAHVATAIETLTPKLTSELDVTSYAVAGD